MPYEVHNIHTGYSKSIENGMEANCTCTLIKGKFNMIVDTMTPWDSDIILSGLEKYGVKREEINYVISTHGHSDHLGNNHLFLNALHIVGHSISRKNHYFDEPFSAGKSYDIDDDLRIIPTPGHTLSDITVLVKTAEGLVAITDHYLNYQFKVWLMVQSSSKHMRIEQCIHEQISCLRHQGISLQEIGDLFEKEEDLENEYLWLGAGSEAPQLQRYNRDRVLRAADYIIPGHGGIFRVTKEIKDSLLHLSI